MCREKTDWEKAMEFHGHICVGLARGYRAAKVGMEILDAHRSPDEELVVIAETDNCGLDAVQVVTGCTMGKGNLIFQDYGKNAYTFGRRDTGKAVRITVKSLGESFPEFAAIRDRVHGGKGTPEDKEKIKKMQMGVITELLQGSHDDLLQVQDVQLDLPEKARIFQSVTCARCGESVMEPRARVRGGEYVCIPCSDYYPSRIAGA
ncbi:MAG: FmdE family protein [Syntrophaceticus sp.]|jgi:formylmethanofuran dehydrogenase subunit E|nr:FmdE family protein [Syntrophaceticus sp.]MDD3314210.1 FmdE family protein [Syntrophaceticus sp.]MDD4360657.1 FmdE family protein [Syntrophaceticus sp.]MDD4783195.1 FmdE family protein [Syntrophaceticus sp.]